MSALIRCGSEQKYPRGAAFPGRVNPLAIDSLQYLLWGDEGLENPSPPLALPFDVTEHMFGLRLPLQHTLACKGVDALQSGLA